MIHFCTDVVARVYDHEGEVDQLMDEVERDILKISEARVTGENDTIKDLVKKAINTIEDYHQRQGMLTGVATGFTELTRDCAADADPAGRPAATTATRPAASADNRPLGMNSEDMTQTSNRSLLHLQIKFSRCNNEEEVLGVRS
jgi:hypothetical protein